MRHFLRRIGFYLVTVWASLTINFLLPRLMPGDPADAVMAKLRDKDVNPEMLRALEAQFGISHAPLWQQYGEYLNNLLHGNLGVSTSFYPTPVATVIAQDMPWTIGLGITTLTIGFVLGTLLGVINAWRRGTKLDTFGSTAMMLISTIPYFWLALIVVYFFAFVFQIFPLYGGYDPDITEGFNPDFIMSVLQHAVLPAITIIVSSLAGWMLTMRNAMVTNLSEDYVLMAKAKGLTNRRVMLAYAARNAILPNVTGFAIAIGFIFGGLLITELVFSYPGIGTAFVEAIENKDYALMQGLFLIITFTVLVANFLADMVYGFLDPRVRQERN